MEIEVKLEGKQKFIGRRTWCELTGGYDYVLVYWSMLPEATDALHYAEHCMVCSPSRQLADSGKYISST
jgi:hypothetical protein